MFTAYRNRLQARSVAILRTLDTRIDRIIIGWMILAALASALRVVPASMRAPVSVGEVLPYFLLVLAPAASVVLALRWFANADRLPQPQFRLARVGSWKSLTDAEASQHPLYGASGI